jgi:hypothetical protein
LSPLSPILCRTPFFLTPRSACISFSWALGVERGGSAMTPFALHRLGIARVLENPSLSGGDRPDRGWSIERRSSEISEGYQRGGGLWFATHSYSDLHDEGSDAFYLLLDTQRQRSRQPISPSISVSPASGYSPLPTCVPSCQIAHQPSGPLRSSCLLLPLSPSLPRTNDQTGKERRSVIRAAI